MAKEFYTEGTGSSQVLHSSQTEKIPVYDSQQDAENDLANLAEGQLVATKDNGNNNRYLLQSEYNSNNTYSTSEVDTGKTWFDGKPIYRKGYQGSFAGSGGGYNIPHNITNLDKVVKVESIMSSPSNFIPSGYYNGNYYFSVHVEPTTLAFRYSTIYEGRDYQAFIEYTKTTD